MFSVVLEDSVFSMLFLRFLVVPVVFSNVSSVVLSVFFLMVVICCGVIGRFLFWTSLAGLYRDFHNVNVVSGFHTLKGRMTWRQLPPPSSFLLGFASIKNSRIQKKQRLQIERPNAKPSET